MAPQHIWAKKQKDGSWLMDALIPLNELKYKLELNGIEGEGFQTLNGFLTWLIGRVPTQAETVDYQRWRFEIPHVKSNRIVQAKVTETIKKVEAEC